MTYRYLAAMVGVAVVALASGRVTGQAPAAAAKAVPATGGGLRTPWGEPDLQGVWRNETTTPMQRPAALGAKEFYTEKEVADAIAKRLAETQPLIDAGVPSGPSRTQPAGTYNRTWQDTGMKPVVYTRTSMIIGPEGRIPYTPLAAKRETETAAHYGQGPYNSWFDLDTGERCLTDGMPGSMYGGTAGAPNQILQGPGYVEIVAEAYRDRRIIPTDGRPHTKIRTLVGEPRGHWEGNTLVVDTTNFIDLSNVWWNNRWREPTETLHMIERFTRVDAETIDYVLTMEDPAKFTKPWTAQVNLTNIHQPMYEYACHEGNYGLVHSLAQARGQEQGRAFEDVPAVPIGSKAK